MQSISRELHARMDRRHAAGLISQLQPCLICACLRVGPQPMLRKVRPSWGLPSGCNYTSHSAVYCMLVGGTSVADMATIAGCPLPNDHHVHDSRHHSGWLWCATPPFGTSPHCCPSTTAGAELSTEVSSCIRLRAVSSLMLATFYLVDGCARLRTDRLHRRERKNSWSARQQAWLARVRAMTLGCCCHVPQRRTPEKPGVLSYEWQGDKRRCSCLLRHVRGTCRPTPPAICAPHMQQHAGGIVPQT